MCLIDYLPESLYLAATISVRCFIRYGGNMKVLLNDGMEIEGLKIFEQAHIQTDTKKRDVPALIEQAGQFDAIVVRSNTKITREIIESGVKGKLKIIGRAGVGVDNIDVEAASENGIVVKFAPFGNTNATAELAFSLLMSLARKIPHANQSLKNRVWKKKTFSGIELSYKTLGIIGCGRIGQRLAKLALGFEMEVVGYDLYPNIESSIRYLSKEEVLKNADFISVHAGGTDTIIGEKEFSLIKPTAFLVNTSRSENVDVNALYKALKEKRIAGAALDVHSEEPKNEDAEFKSQFLEFENVLLTSHLGASTNEAQTKTSLEMAQVIVDYLQKGDFTNTVNAKERVEFEEKSLYPLFIHHKDIPGAFAKIDQVLADNGVNIRETNSRQIGKSGHVLTIFLTHQSANEKLLSELKKLSIVSHVKTYE